MKKVTIEKDQKKIDKNIDDLLIKTKMNVTEQFINYLYRSLARNINVEKIYVETALSRAVRDSVLGRWQKSQNKFRNNQVKKAYYLSMEFLIGRSLQNNAICLDIENDIRKSLCQLGLEMEEILEAEKDAGLGNGGLGRLAACFMDSCATLGLPVTGYGLRYEYGMFHQLIKDGYQVESPDHWLRFGAQPWEVIHKERTKLVEFGGHTHVEKDIKTGKEKVIWESSEKVRAVPFDIPIIGYQNDVVNTLRLWSSISCKDFDLSAFNKGSYAESVINKYTAETITRVLYPNDSSENGKELRLKQQYFLVSASLQDVIFDWKKYYNSQNFDHFADKNVFQLNDTHPSLAIAELMRLLVDVEGLEWNKAWEITTQTMAYTNHTLLPEALERWSVGLFERILPRTLEIIYRINAEFLYKVEEKWPGDFQRRREMSLIDENNMIRMAYLAIVGSFSINGVAALHTKLLKEGLFNDFYQLWPKKFNNKTNGVTQRRWLVSCNPGLRELLDETIGNKWVTDLSEISKIEQFVDDPKFRKKWLDVKQNNKKSLVKYVLKKTGIRFNPTSIFDIQVKRIHEYKRQLLNVLHIIHLYSRIKEGDTKCWTNRCVLIGGKAAPGYFIAKNIIKLINNVADVVNNDPEVGDRLKVVFLPNYCVSAMEMICPAADLSEQISTAGKEASGTGNMKFMINGAITIGTLDGANVEILEEVENENFYLFGLTSPEVETLRPLYQPHVYIQNDPCLTKVMNLLESGHFNQNEPRIFDALIQTLLSPHDQWMTLADFRSYIDTQQRAATDFQDKEKWVTMSIINSARSGMFSTDRTMFEYNRDIWKLTPISKIK